MGKCKCGRPRREKQRTCRECHAAYMREWRKTHPLTEEQRRRMVCRSYAKVYEKRGVLRRQPCQVCGESDGVQKHHPDYDRPLLVVWLCREHHQQHHNGKLVLPDPIQVPSHYKGR